MFYGTFEGRLDKNRRLVIPVGLGDDICGDRLVLKEGQDHCLEVHMEADLLLNGGNQLEELFIVKCEKDKRRITVPTAFSHSNSFFFGRKVILLGKGSYIRILPGPPRKRNIKLLT